MKLILSECSLDLLLEVLAINSIFLIFLAKHITFLFITENIKQLRKRVRNNWSVLVNDQEIDIMHKYTNGGKSFTKIFAISIYFGIFAFTLMQYLPDLLDGIVPLNESRPSMLIHQAKYFTNQEKYFYILIMHEVIGMFLCATTAIAAESFSLVNALHAFGMFNVASYRMEHMLSINISQIRELAKSCDSTIIFCDKIVAAVDIHKRAMQFSDLLQKSLGLSYLFIIVMTICTAAVSLYRIFRVITMQQEELELIKLFYYVSLLFSYLIIGNFVGQEFINRDDRVHRMICNTKWYKAPVKIQKSLLFLLRKTTKTYKVNAAGLFCPSLEGLARSLSFMVSFLTLLCSI
ncbi:PREDICTED: uncharacterized protein LOC105568483 [Vollenhovia emeryi]|uniref:uncharacterized protein LOC105568483 n=1 Tax=Vollenhovia emeryi TaxID=411798 RepID=UPI0005F49E77|nr:PREDICTED: uncharacterized protein LOC105568483 [Vollenhovia emeryi]